MLSGGLVTAALPMTWTVTAVDAVGRNYTIDSYTDDKNIVITYTTSPTGLTNDNKIATQAYEVKNISVVMDETETVTLAQTAEVWLHYLWNKSRLAKAFRYSDGVSPVTFL